jgi:hypothetical protein
MGREAVGDEPNLARQSRSASTFLVRSHGNGHPTEVGQVLGRAIPFLNRSRKNSMNR